MSGIAEQVETCKTTRKEKQSDVVIKHMSSANVSWMNGFTFKKNAGARLCHRKLRVKEVKKRKDG